MYGYAGSWQPDLLRKRRLALQNHWLLSHDNVWNPMPAPDKGSALPASSSTHLLGFSFCHVAILDTWRRAACHAEMNKSKEIDSDDDEYWPGHHVERTTSSMLQTRRGNSYGQSRGVKYRHAYDPCADQGEVIHLIKISNTQCAITMSMPKNCHISF